MAALVSFYKDKPTAPSNSDSRLQIEQLPISAAGRFELGHAEIGTAYVRHPQRPKRLIPLANYHSQTLVEKANEAILMLTALGASSVDLTYSSKVSEQIKADLELLFGLVAFGGSKDDDTRLVYRARGAGAAPRALPPLLWLDQPGWRGVVDGRLYGGLNEFALSFTYEHQCGVDAELVARVRKFGLRIGGEFRKSHRVSFNLEGRFPVLQPDGIDCGSTDTGAAAQ